MCLIRDRNGSVWPTVSLTQIPVLGQELINVDVTAVQHAVCCWRRRQERGPTVQHTSVVEHNCITWLKTKLHKPAERGGREEQESGSVRTDTAKTAAASAHGPLRTHQIALQWLERSRCTRQSKRPHAPEQLARVHQKVVPRTRHCAQGTVTRTIARDHGPCKSRRNAAYQPHLRCPRLSNDTTGRRYTICTGLSRR